MSLLRLFVVSLALLCAIPAPVAAQTPPPVQNSVTYRYDALGRLIEVRYPNGRVVTYSYDPAGNRKTVNVGG